MSVSVFGEYVSLCSDSSLCEGNTNGRRNGPRWLSAEAEPRRSVRWSQAQSNKQSNKQSKETAMRICNQLLFVSDTLSKYS